MSVGTLLGRPVPRPVLAASAVFLVALAWGGCVASNRYLDYGAASAELPEAVAAYRAAALPWTSDEIAPRPKIAPGDDATPLIRQAIAAFAQRAGKEDGLVARKAAEKGDWRAVAEFLNGKATGLALLERATARSACDLREDEDQPVDPGNPYVGITAGVGNDLADSADEALSDQAVGAPELSYGVEALVLRAKLRAARGQGEEAVRDLGRVRKIARFVGTSTDFLAGFSREIRFERQALFGACRIAAMHPKLAPALLAQVEADASEPDPIRPLRGMAYADVARFRNGAGRDLERYDFLSSGAPPEERRGPVQRDGVPTDEHERAYLCRSLQFWTSVEPTIQRLKGDPVKLAHELYNRAMELTDRTGLSYRYTYVAFYDLDEPLAELRADRAITRATLRALIAQERTRKWPTPLISGVDPFGKAYIGRTEGKGFRILSLGKGRNVSTWTVAAQHGLTSGLATTNLVSVYAPAAPNAKLGPARR